MSAAQSDDDPDTLLARIALQIEALRRGGGDADDAALRSVLADLTRVAARLRADATAIGHALAGVLEPPPERPASNDTPPA